MVLAIVLAHGVPINAAVDCHHHMGSPTSAELACDRSEDPTFLAGDEDALWFFRFVATIALVDIGALDSAAGELLGGLDDVTERVPVEWVARQRLAVQHELAARGARIGGDDRSLDAEPFKAPWDLPVPVHSTSGAWKE